MVVSMGVSFFPREGDTYEGLFNLADQRLYRAKQEGKGRLCTE
jgi:GGDEF domain-containing protein